MTETGSAAEALDDQVREDIGQYSLWLSRRLLPADPLAARAIGTELDELGVGAVWLGGSPPADLEQPEQLLEGSRRLTVGTSIVNIWFADPVELAASRERVAGRHPGRLILGLGIGHAPAVESSGQRYVKPYSRMVEYLDRLDATRPAVPVRGRMLAALGPRTLALAADRSAGSLPYLTTPEHTARARETLGSDALLIPEHKVVLSTDAAFARERGRKYLATYLSLPNYVNTWLGLGFTEDDVTGGGSDRLVDAMVLYGTLDHVMSRLREHLDAGADQVAVQPITQGGIPHEDWRLLAEAFRG